MNIRPRAQKAKILARLAEYMRPIHFISVQFTFKILLKFYHRQTLHCPAPSQPHLGPDHTVFSPQLGQSPPSQSASPAVACDAPKRTNGRLCLLRSSLVPFPPQENTIRGQLFLQAHTLCSSCLPCPLPPSPNSQPTLMKPSVRPAHLKEPLHPQLLPHNTHTFSCSAFSLPGTYWDLTYIFIVCFLAE